MPTDLEVLWMNNRHLSGTEGLIGAVLILLMLAIGHLSFRLLTAHAK